jgi:serine/threonine protein kinase
MNGRRRARDIHPMHSAQETPARPTPLGFRVDRESSPGSSREVVQISSERKGVLRPLLDADSPEAARLTQELQLLAQVRGKNVVEVLGTHVQDGKLCCVTERIEAEDLETLLRRGHRFTTEEIHHIAEGIVRGLSMASSFRFLHLDLRPGNVLMLEDGQVKVANFGSLAQIRKLDGAAAPTPTMVAYLSPEQGMGQPIDIRSNIYSVGAILYEVATLRTPFEGYDSSTSLLYQLLHVDPVAPHQLGSSIPKELERTILRCLSKDPGDRYAHPAELLEAIQQSRDSISSRRIPAIESEDDTGDFDIFEDQPLGEGGMGTLIRGRQRSLDRSVAIKVIREAFHTNPEFLQRFRREAELLAQIDNANVVQVIGTGVWRGRLFYAMELVKGEDLAARQRRGHLTMPDELLNIAEGVGNALRAAWRYKIVHRDIKPSNIMITPEGMVKVADFGLAKSLRMPGTESRVMAGTPEYLSPEQGLGQKADIRSDLYSLGVVLYELAAGRHPFGGTQSSVAMIYQHVHTEPPPLVELNPSLPHAIRSLIHRCLEKNPEARFSDPDELLTAIRTARKNMTIPPTEKRSKGAFHRISLRRLALILGAGFALGVIGFAGWAIRSKWSSRPDPSFERTYGLAMGLGDYAEAMRMAETRVGRGSSEYREAEQRERGSRLRPLLEKARVRSAAHDWAGAAQAFAALHSLGKPDSTREIEIALAYCQNLAEAADKETRGDWRGALEIYSRLENGGTIHKDYLQECIRKARGHLLPSAPH